MPFLAAVLLVEGCGRTPAAAVPAHERVIQHALGETRVQGTPKRVVVQDTGELDTALSLGVKPV